MKILAIETSCDPKGKSTSYGAGSGELNFNSNNN